ncbi:MAG: M23 family metallopeptidase [Clostridia bacterium]|nr:M23 family metallopeptidase [Clostridia bacterium]
MDKKAMVETSTGSMQIRERRTLEAAPKVEWASVPRKRRGEALLKNMAVASSLVLCAVALRTGELPVLSEVTDIVMTAVTDDSLLDEDLGKLSFVSSLFPEATLVFGESGGDLSLPVSGGAVVHAWSESEPYMSWRTDSSVVTSASSGEVIGVYHGYGDEHLVQVMGDDGLSCMYGNLAEIAVSTGDWINSGDTIGTLLAGSEFVFEVRRDGMSIDPALYLP